MPEFSQISVVGLGYIGLPTAAMFASRKIKVVGVDINSETVETINRGEVHIVEPDLDIAVRSSVKDGYLYASTKPKPAQAFLIAVPTPFRGESKSPDLTYIKEAALSIAPVLEKGNLVILESTSPVGATEQMADWLNDARPDLTFPQTHSERSDIRIAHCPERVLPGKTMQELVTNDRIIGGMTPTCSEYATKLYKTFVTGQCVVASNARTAELAKLSENSYRDVNIAFANELSLICDKLSIDVWELIELSNRHPRVNVLSPGPGVGGHCIAVDPWFIVASAPEESKLVRCAREVNDFKPSWIINKVLDAVESFQFDAQNPKQSNLKLACYGLTYKADIDDLRESPALEIVGHLESNFSGEIIVVEPYIDTLPKSLSRSKLRSFDYAVQNADLHVVLVAHSSFDFSTLKNSKRILAASATP